MDMVAPTDMSIPSLMMTRVWPAAAMSSMEVSDRILPKATGFRLLGLRAMVARNSSALMISAMPIWWFLVNVLILEAVLLFIAHPSFDLLLNALEQGLTLGLHREDGADQTDEDDSVGHEVVPVGVVLAGIMEKILGTEVCTSSWKPTPNRAQAMVPQPPAREIPPRMQALMVCRP